LWHCGKQGHYCPPTPGTGEASPGNPCLISPPAPQAEKTLRNQREGSAGCCEDGGGPRAGGLRGAFEGAGLVQWAAEEAGG